MDVQSHCPGSTMIMIGPAPLRVVFRTDASVDIGTGHVMRCLTLANALRERGADCLFICRPHSGHLFELIARHGHQISALPELVADPTLMRMNDLLHAHWLGTNWETDASDTSKVLDKIDADLLIVDHYALDVRWEQVLKTYCKRMIVIDDLADRFHDCDILLDQNLGRTATDYSGLTHRGTDLLIGPKYALVRAEFAQLRAESLMRRVRPQLKQLLITMGGVDKDNVTGRVLGALNTSVLPCDLNITVVMGPHAPWRQSVQKQANKMRNFTQVLVGIDNMARLMTDSDLAIGAAGSTTWERCCLGLPTIQLVLAENQRSAADSLVALGAVYSIPSIDCINVEIPMLMSLIESSPQKQRQISERSAAVCDGRGAIEIADWLFGENK